MILINDIPYIIYYLLHYNTAEIIICYFLLNFHIDFMNYIVFLYYKYLNL